jgi:hypothetical protein
MRPFLLPLLETLSAMLHKLQISSSRSLKTEVGCLPVVCSERFALHGKPCLVEYRNAVIDHPSFRREGSNSEANTLQM